MKKNLLLSFIFLFSIITGNYSTDKNPTYNLTSKNFCFNSAEGLIPSVYAFCIVSCSIQLPAHYMTFLYKANNTDFLINSNLNSVLSNSN